MNTHQIIQQSAALRAQGRNTEAIALIDANLSEFPDDVLVVAWREKFLAAQAAALPEAKDFARKVLELDPGMPSARKFLGA